MRSPFYFKIATCWNYNNEKLVVYRFQNDFYLSKISNLILLK